MSGRARRAEYWYFALFNFLISLVLAFIGMALAGGRQQAGMFLADLYTLAVLLPSIAVAVRRLHDINRSGWWLLIALIPFIGVIVLLIFDCMPGTAGPNQYGPDPKASEMFATPA